MIIVSARDYVAKLTALWILACTPRLLELVLGMNETMCCLGSYNLREGLNISDSFPFITFCYSIIYEHLHMS